MTGTFPPGPRPADAGVLAPPPPTAPPPIPSPAAPPPTVPAPAAHTYDGARPFAACGEPAEGASRFGPSGKSGRRRRTAAQRVALAVTGVIVCAPFAALGLALWLWWGSTVVRPADLVLALVLYVVTGLGVTVGFHRGLTHGGFRAVPALRIALATAGSLSFQGDVIGWVATHRRHHAFTDRPGDPHSPYRYGAGVTGQLRGLLDSHVGWLFRNDATPAERYAPDLLADRGLRTVSRLFPLLCAVTLAVPFCAGLALGGGAWRAGLSALLWAGLVRIALLHHVTWSVNSLCHVIGSRPFATRRHDRATNLWPLALLSFGESWHNLHHADPTCARHGVDRGQIDPSAAVIRLFERLGWVHDVRWPAPERLDARRLPRTPRPPRLTPTGGR